ncbi:DUF1579 family protein [Pontibacter chinhatensis]|uniref:DUF1579 domain-containing protein n=1 Tax=Pontibacter chinhatensis TaxID=1436961 RepID=A0A1I2RH17_9BACT|nr:DUF1579 family protein [Pontibacter chinhatensis]SFG37066.1 Protein of unknown function [Pontibacter chinhatensis]
MKKVIFTLLAMALLVVTAPGAQAQETEAEQLSSKQAHELLRRLSGNWLVSHYSWQPHSKMFHQTTGEANISRARQGSYLLEQTDVKLPDGSIQRQECFLGYSLAKGRFELIQADGEDKNTSLLVGEWNPEYNAITLRHPDGLKKGDPTSMEYVYIFLPQNTLLKMARSLDEEGNYLIHSKVYFVPRHTALH